MSATRLAWCFTLYLAVSFILFLMASNTILGAIAYLFLLLPFYGILLILCWLLAWRHRGNSVTVKRWIWGLVLGLQVLTLLASPGNCFSFKQGDRCYSNLQILAGRASRSGPQTIPHWHIVEDAFPALLVAYGVSVATGLLKTSVTPPSPP
ncbi:hypothetical protein [Lyngbya confervoides]|uniref:Uncharacterized protein n=1 Tax=Lyngbya confervoides BDU141951 TaxID=1574623 RepID=A0ABD4SZF1_9CYAN|nr:hypothetical protein [Lyngbya confervoides]MCM1981725.1 hypothetical protein [Lyngbya confervoides BDU141951]